MTSKPPAEHEQRQITITDAARMRALAHPARLALLDRLQVSGAATATECAEGVGLSPSATSYHLRALARVGLVEQAPDRGDARERVWRAVDVSFTVDAGLNASPEALAAERELVEAWLAQENARLRRWMARSQSEPAEWYHAARNSSTVLMATAEELKELGEAIDKLLDPLRHTRRTDPPPGARMINATMHIIPVDFPVHETG
jgi:DNA-binding transcriptional ArsR family regulator